MVRERRTARPKAEKARRTRAKAGSIWETPHLKEILSQPVGTSMELTRDEALAIVKDMLEHPGPYRAAEARRAHAELRKIRRMWGSIARDV
jgi:hypothetical protein